MVTSKDVAKKAGVSQSTVSRVINDSKSVSKEKSKIVEKVMKELNYRPDSVAKSLIQNKTNQVALISGTLNNPFFIETTMRITNYAYKKGYNVNVYFEENFLIDEVYETVFNQRNAGIILSSMYYESPYYSELNKLGIPHIMFNRRHKDSNCFVEIDNVEAGKIACDYLINSGYKNIHWFGGEMYKSTFYERYQGFTESMHSNNLSYSKTNISITEQKPSTIREELQTVLNSKNRPSAILAGTDMIGLIIMDELKRRDIDIPGEISIIGIDNTDAAKHNSHNLTSVGIDERINLGEIAIKNLIEMIEENTNKKIQKRYPCQVFERGTV